MKVTVRMGQNGAESLGHITDHASEKPSTLSTFLVPLKIADPWSCYLEK